MGRPEKLERYRDHRDYAGLLDDEDSELEDWEEDDVPEPLMENPKDNISQECQEYYERRERLKELERQRFRRINDNGKGLSATKSKPLPYDNYGTFFGPSEPIVTRRIITDIRARETASKVAARQAQEVSEPERVSKGSSGMVVEPRISETATPKQPKDQALKLQRLKESRDYSFLFTDEDPSATLPHDDTRASTKGRQDSDYKQHLSGKGTLGPTSRVPNGAKPLIPSSVKPGMGSKADTSKPEARHTPSGKLTKPPVKPALPKEKVPPQSGSVSYLSKTLSGPDKLPQARPNVPKSGLPNEKRPLPSSRSPQSLKSLVASNPKGATKQALPSTPAKPALGKGSLLKSATVGSKEKQLPQISGKKSDASTSRPAQKPGMVTMGRGASTAHLDKRRPAPSAITSKMKVKPPPKRTLDSESEDSFLDDDGEGQDYSSMIRKMFGYNPNKYRDIDDEDDRLMEANFHTIQMEEKRSARIAREEDERELALIEEEERRERERARKKRKQQR